MTARVRSWRPVLAIWLCLILALVVWNLPRAATLPASAQRLAAIVVLMAGLWLAQPIPIAATSLIPVVAFPLCGIMSARDVSTAYMSPSIFLFLGGFIIALGIERWGLHRRLALRIVATLGRSQRLVVLGFMVATAGLSMWISNTASALLMLPIALALLKSLEEAQGPVNRRFALAILLGVAYCASIGGMLTLVGTPTNIAYQESFAASFPRGPEVSSAQWLMIFLPMGVCFVAAAWGVLTWRIPRETRPFPQQLFLQHLDALGPPSPAEWRMGLMVAATISLWIFKDPLVLTESVKLPGWGPSVEAWLLSLGTPEKEIGKYLHDATVAVAMAILMFVVPAGVEDGSENEEGTAPRLMDWRTAERLPWGILLLIGGGFAIAKGFETTGLSKWVGDIGAHYAAGQPLWLVVLTICVLMTLLTEFTTNVATAVTVLPVLGATAVSLGIDPRVLMIPAVIACSSGFMLPIGTPPNAIVCSSGHVRTADMVRAGFFVNVIGVILITATTLTLLLPLLGIDLQRLPEWAQPTEDVDGP